MALGALPVKVVPGVMVLAVMFLQAAPVVTRYHLLPVALVVLQAAAQGIPVEPMLKTLAAVVVKAVVARVIQTPVLTVLEEAVLLPPEVTVGAAPALQIIVDNRQARILDERVVAVVAVEVKVLGVVVVVVVGAQVIPETLVIPVLRLTQQLLTVCL